MRYAFEFAWIRPYGDDEVAALLQAAHDPHDAVLVLLGAHAGLRAQECTNLCWAGVHLAHATWWYARARAANNAWSP